jgi:hypothetical protein
MKWYLASRTKHTKQMQEFAKVLIANGQEISSTWIYIEEQLKPFLDNFQRVQDISVENVKQLLQTDVFVLFNDLEGVDIFIELGVVLGMKETGKDVRIYVIGDYGKTSFTQLHPSIIHVKGLGEVYEAEKINHTENDIIKI